MICATMPLMAADYNPDLSDKKAYDSLDCNPEEDVAGRKHRILMTALINKMLNDIVKDFF